MVYLIKDTVDIYCFYKDLHETAQNTGFAKLPPVIFKQIEKFLHFSFKTAENFSN